MILLAANELHTSLKRSSGHTAFGRITIVNNQQTLNLGRGKGAFKFLLTIVMLFISENSAAVICITVIVYSRKIYCTSEDFTYEHNFSSQTEPQ